MRAHKTVWGLVGLYLIVSLLAPPAVRAQGNAASGSGSEETARSAAQSDTAAEGGSQYVSQARDDQEVQETPAGPRWLHWWTGRSFMGKVWLLVKILVLLLIIRLIVKVLRSMFGRPEKAASE